ncbi:hypothetical protein PoB_003798800 [Plakobranchus ocellatus]|uniref:Uncharacterized protein n=1 Tax=Plakobranchus ocellatus TaxID=259542 RepID=A0AAV4AVW5_9GAST|nr:hypothetical protein PoB_003798800 [Plakobranchus ocellatus]
MISGFKVLRQANAPVPGLEPTTKYSLHFSRRVRYPLYQYGPVYFDIEKNWSSPQQDDLRLSGHPLGQGAGGGARTRDRGVPADFRTDSLATVLPTPAPLSILRT